ncbi:LOW QUALITY PROTEIN: hypothetical protein PoB_003976800 [Plakobranchus ocellatus]|uniref:Endonuclease/exonuclease/phosphatase domain-containing protein n=1 Tax=Plakobranchus ocellatus TaxID=259542 RepID=A0AAV4B2B6_9GAST|nr:LOW QUALITY PROTEIN: hypothetical protein PoB_003976800 [Plakobranchus ocellatus]
MEASDEAELLGTVIHFPDSKLTICNYYAPPDKELRGGGGGGGDSIKVPQEDSIIVGDFNSHSLKWGYEDLYTRGEEVEEWQVINNLQLLIDKDDEPTFYSRAWMTTFTQGLAFATSNILREANQQVLAPLITSDHKPIAIAVTTQPAKKSTPTTIELQKS